MKKSYGFTLIELIVVISVIAILAGMVTPLVSSVTEQARDARMKSDVNSMKSAIVNYNAKRAVFPGPASAANATLGFDAVTAIPGTTVNAAGYYLNSTTLATITNVSNRLTQFLAKPITTDPWNQPYRYYIDTRTTVARTGRVGFVGSIGLNQAQNGIQTAANMYNGNAVGDDYYDCFYKG